MTPEGWRSDNDWKHGPRRIVVSGERPDPAQLPETAGESDPPPSRRRVSLDDIALLLAATVILAGLYVFADWLVKL